jgi:predicted DNA-binding transcriptional regulator YafY
MATTKFATIRYQALDRCFSNFGRKYDINALVDACNDAIYEYMGESSGISKRTVYEDINFMQSQQGWLVELEKIKQGKQVFYRYADPNYSINQQSFNESEITQLQETISILNRFKGVQQFEWLEEVKLKMETAYKINTDSKPIVGFEQNPFLKGLDHFSKLFQAIEYKTVLKIKYQGYKQVKPVEMIIHPYYLKQYNNRWFLFGLNDDRKDISNLALDRIQDFKETKIKYRETEIDFDEYFDDVIGVTVKDDVPVEKVLLKISKDRWSYIESKPIHGSQKPPISIDDTGVIIQLELQINKELVNTILGFGADVKVIEPKYLKEQVINKIKQMNENYFDV